jgi:hypothetical protein
MIKSIVRPTDEAFLKSWKDSGHCFSPEELDIVDKGGIICVEKIPKKIKFFAKTFDGKPKSICFPYEGMNGDVLFQKSFGQYCSESVQESVLS